MGLEVVPKIQTLFIRTLAKPLGKLSRDLGDPSGAAEITTPPDRTRAAPRAMQRSPAAVRTPKGSGDRVMARGGPVGGRGGSSPESFDSSLNQWDFTSIFDFDSMLFNSRKTNGKIQATSRETELVLMSRKPMGKH